VCSGANFDMVRSLGAKSLIDYTQEDYRKGPNTYDIVFDAVGKISRAGARKILKKDGAFVSVKMLTQEKDEYLDKIRNMVENGQLRPFIDRSYHLDELVTAHEYVDSGRKRGNVAIVVSSG
ncbi:MAG: zinc-binding dehydrogenase, partial [Cyclobacteriaceae bacterium]